MLLGLVVVGTGGCELFMDAGVGELGLEGAELGLEGAELSALADLEVLGAANLGETVFALRGGLTSVLADVEAEGGAVELLGDSHAARARVVMSKGTATVYDAAGDPLVKAVRDGDTIVYETMRDKPLGRSRIVGESKVEHYFGPQDKYIGFDIIDDDVIRHYSGEPVPRYLGETRLGRPGSAMSSVNTESFRAGLASLLAAGDSDRFRARAALALAFKSPSIFSITLLHHHRFLSRTSLHEATLTVGSNTMRLEMKRPPSVKDDPLFCVWRSGILPVERITQMQIERQGSTGVLLTLALSAGKHLDKTDTLSFAVVGSYDGIESSTAAHRFGATSTTTRTVLQSPRHAEAQLSALSWLIGQVRAAALPLEPGNWRGFFVDKTLGTNPTTWNVVVSGETVRGTFSVQTPGEVGHGDVDGHLRGGLLDATLTISKGGFAPPAQNCAGRLVGTFKMEAASIRGDYATQLGPGCNPPNIRTKGSLELTKQ